jgi:hypothetical protein
MSFLGVDFSSGPLWALIVIAFQLVCLSLFLFILYSVLSPLFTVWSRAWEFLHFGWQAMDYVTGGTQKPDTATFKQKKDRWNEVWGPK